MAKLMRCEYCGLLQDEPPGVKQCSRCGGSLDYESGLPSGQTSYLQVQMELDQIAAPAGRNVERYLMITIRTPAKVPSEDAAPVGMQRPALSFASVLDVSGSMHGEKISQAKEAVRQSVHCLHAGDNFSLVTFSNEVQCPFEPADVNEQTISMVEGALQEITAGGMTALCTGLELGIEKTAAHPKDTNLVLLLSDGQANVGETDLEKIGQRSLRAREQGLLVSTLGVGMDYNEALLAEIATQGGGRFYHVVNAMQIPAYVAGELGEVAALAARDVKIHLAIPNGATLVALSAAFPIQQEGEQAVVSVGDIPCDTELEIPIRLTLVAQAAGSKFSVHGRLEFHSPAGNRITIPVNRVTLRIVERDTFRPREGTVLPVAERVFFQLKAASVLDISRTIALRPDEAEQFSRSVLGSLHTYADLLGEERAEKEMTLVKEEFAAFETSPAATKQAVAAAYRSVHASRDFNQ